MASDKPWSDFSQSDYNPDQWKRACLIDKGTGDPMSKDRYALPVREPDGTLNSNAVHAAAGRIGQVQGISPDKRKAAARSLVRLYGQLGEDAPEDLEKLAGTESASEDAAEQRAMRGPVEERAATVDRVDFGQRILTVVAVPFEQPTPVEYRAEIWHEVFDRAAFQGFDPAKRRVPVSAVLRAPAFDHNGGHLVGKVAAVAPDSADGLILDMRISSTPAGDETLQLAKDDALSPSVGFVARGSDQQLDRRSMTRRIRRAFLDHVSMVPTPAYDGARVLSMRDQGPMVSARELPRLVTPALDEFLAAPINQWVDDRFGQ